jgi:hypothetical protein
MLRPPVYGHRPAAPDTPLVARAPDTKPDTGRDADDVRAADRARCLRAWLTGPLTTCAITGGLLGAPLLTCIGMLGALSSAQSELHQIAPALLGLAPAGFLLAMLGAHFIHIQRGRPPRSDMDGDERSASNSARDGVRTSATALRARPRAASGVLPHLGPPPGEPARPHPRGRDTEAARADDGIEWHDGAVPPDVRRDPPMAQCVHLTYQIHPHSRGGLRCTPTSGRSRGSACRLTTRVSGEAPSRGRWRYAAMRGAERDMGRRARPRRAVAA